MAFYYYTSASLPMLTTPGGPPPLTDGEFLEECRRFLKPVDMEGILRSTLDPSGPPAPGIAVPFRQWETALRNALVTRRATEQGLHAADFTRPGVDVFGVEGIAAEAMTKSTPLEAEIFLDDRRWNRVDDLVAGRFFDIEFLRGYRLKLLIWERRALFEEEKGYAAYRELYARILEGAGDAVPLGSETP